MKNTTQKNIHFLLSSMLFMSLILIAIDTIYQLFIVKDQHLNTLEVLSSAIPFNIVLAGISTILFAGVFLPLQLLNRLLAKVLFISLNIIVILAVLGLNQYAAQTHLPLGSDLFGYKLDDILFITGSSAEISAGTILLFLTLPACYVLLLMSLKGKAISYVSIGLFLLSIGTISFLADDLTEKSKSAYFLNDARQYYQDSRLGNNAEFLADGSPFPLMHKFESGQNGLSEHMTLRENKPNIILLVVEGLGGDFMGKTAQYPGFTPYLDSLSNHSLYYTRFMSNTGRSFGALPSILGSAPFGKNGFLELENLPEHMSLISVLKQNGYETSYYEGGNSAFDNKNRYLVNEGVDNLIDENSFDENYQKTNSTKEGFSWGYPDSEIYRKTLASLPEGNQPRLDVVLSISNHEPFSFPYKEKYLATVKKMIETNPALNGYKETIEEHPEVFASLLYTDFSIKEFMEGLQKRPDFENTIVMITGDHRLIPVAMKNQICRYHVPLLVYSPLVNEPKEINTVSSHMDLTPAITGLLAEAYHMKTPKDVPWLGLGLAKNQEREIPFMKYKGSFSDYVVGNTFLAQGKTYEIEEHLSLTEVKSPERKSLVQNALAHAKKVNRYTTSENKMIPPELKMNISNLIEISATDQKRIKGLIKGKNQSEIYFMARDSAHNQQYEIALLLLDHLNNLNYNHFDGRTLRGRIYGWNKQPEKAEEALHFVIERSPLYTDAYSALLDLYWWNSLGDKALEIEEIALQRFQNNPQFLRTVEEKMKRFDPEDFEEEVVMGEQLTFNLSQP
ncbi:sulfatase-like hydrolase/transferase [Jiulongibacter sp. NS-SX5]|uniref:sulfatase-like hydrolase/transferase n=1 Tax=Jiulongibacter sp. NS-SX5 TaxID=3463854 RepID=UPI0040581438